MNRLQEAIKQADTAGGIIADQVAFLISRFDPEDHRVGSTIHNCVNGDTPLIQRLVQEITGENPPKQPVQMAMLSASEWREREDEVGLVSDLICREWSR